MAATLLLDPETWDLTLDASGNVAVAQAPYALAQDASSACRLFRGELWYDTTQGINYSGNILGFQAPISLLRADLIAAAETVPDVTAAKVFVTAIIDRRVVGQVQVFDSSGNLLAANF